MGYSVVISSVDGNSYVTRRGVQMAFTLPIICGQPLQLAGSDSSELQCQKSVPGLFVGEPNTGPDEITINFYTIPTTTGFFTCRFSIPVTIRACNKQLTAEAQVSLFSPDCTG